VLLVICIVSLEIIRYMQKVEHSTRQNAKMFVYAALLFEYATFIVIYVFDYILVAEDRKDNFIIYYVSTLVAIVIASCGFILFRKFDSSSKYLKN
jgi:cell shape-determining protein MreD